MRLARPTLPETRRPLLKKLLREERVLRAIEAHNPLSALIGASAVSGSGTRKTEFDLLWLSGFSHATALGLPDAELSLLERRLDFIADIAAVTEKPMIADGDTGGDAMALSYLCRRLEALGVSAVIVEDKAGAKRTSLAEDAHHELENPQVFTAKLAQAKQSVLSPDFLIFARIESLIAGAGLADALERAQIYLQSHADGLVIHSKDPTGAEVLKFAEGLRKIQAKIGITKPLVCIPTAYNHITATELYAHGVHIVIHGNHMIRAAYQAMVQAAESILSHDRSAEADSVCAPVKALFASIGVDSATR